MLQPFRLALALALVWGVPARAEEAPAGRLRRERPVTVVGRPDEPLPVIHVAQESPTLLLFPAPIQRKSLTFNESRIRVLDAGERSVIVQPVEDLREGERHELGIYFADGRTPERAAFVLVTDPSEVDTRIDVRRPAPPEAACPTEVQVRAPQPEDFLLLGYMGEEGIPASEIRGVRNGGSGLRPDKVTTYRGKGWGLIDIKLDTENESTAWVPREATMTRKTGLPLRARLVTVGGGAIPPRDVGRVLVVADAQALSEGAVFTVKVIGEDGRGVTVSDVRFPEPAPGGVP
ncbi:DUF2381 family protein [Myxococcaceae bacterium GXIMD 01537]